MSLTRTALLKPSIVCLEAIAGYQIPLLYQKKSLCKDISFICVNPLVVSSSWLSLACVLLMIISPLGWAQAKEAVLSLTMASFLVG
jgi:hypothetical protein